MKRPANPSPTLAAALWPATVASPGQAVRAALLVLAGAALLTVSARAQIPFWPVPVTMQTFVVLVLGMAYGPALGVASVAAYLAAGAAGLPVFAGTPEKGIGLAYMLGPTGGYLAGFIAAAWVAGRLAQLGWDRRVAGTVAAMVAGNLLIYACGLLWLGAVIGWDKPVLKVGMLLFLPGDALKIALAAALLPAVWRWRR